MYSRRKKGKAKNEDESTAHCVYCMQYSKGYFKGVGGLGKESKEKVEERMGGLNKGR